MITAISALLGTVVGAALNFFFGQRLQRNATLKESVFNSHQHLFAFAEANVQLRHAVKAAVRHRYKIAEATPESQEKTNAIDELEFYLARIHARHKDSFDEVNRLYFNVRVNLPQLLNSYSELRKCHSSVGKALEEHFIPALQNFSNDPGALDASSKRIHEFAIQIEPMSAAFENELIKQLPSESGQVASLPTKVWRKIRAIVRRR